LSSGKWLNFGYHDAKSIFERNKQIVS